MSAAAPNLYQLTQHAAARTSNFFKVKTQNVKEKMKKGKVKTFAFTAAPNLYQLTQQTAARSSHLEKKIKSNTDKNNIFDAERR